VTRVTLSGFRTNNKHKKFAHIPVSFSCIVFISPTLIQYATMAPGRRARGASRARAARISTRSRTAAAARNSDDGGPAELSPAPEPRPVPAAPASSVASTVVATPSGQKRLAPDTVSAPVAPSAFLMRLQLAPIPVAKRTAALPPRLARSVCLRCSKRIDKSSVLSKKGKAVSVGSGCVKTANKKCDYCALQHHDCEEVSWRSPNIVRTHAERLFRFLLNLWRSSTRCWRSALRRLRSRT